MFCPVKGMTRFLGTIPAIIIRRENAGAVPPFAAFGIAASMSLISPGKSANPTTILISADTPTIRHESNANLPAMRPTSEASVMSVMPSTMAEKIIGAAIIPRASINIPCAVLTKRKSISLTRDGSSIFLSANPTASPRTIARTVLRNGCPPALCTRMVTMLLPFLRV